MFRCRIRKVDLLLRQRFLRPTPRTGCEGSGSFIYAQRILYLTTRDCQGKREEKFPGGYPGSIGLSF